MKGRLTDNDIAKAFEFLKHTDAIKESRSNFFLVAEAMLVAAMVTIDANAYLERACVVLLGLIFTFSWWVNLKRLSARINFVVKEYLLEDEVYNACITSAKGIHGKIYMVHLLPLCVLLFWVVMVVALVRSRM